MAAIVKCDTCGRVVPYTKACHVRAYKLSSATTFNSCNTEEAFDMCDGCLRKLKDALKKGGDKSNAD